MVNKINTADHYAPAELSVEGVEKISKRRLVRNAEKTTAENAPQATIV